MTLKTNHLNFQSKLPAVGTTIFTVMSSLAQEHNAVNLGQGFPDFPMDPLLIDLVDKAMRDGYNQYSPMQGYLPLREVLADKAAFLYNQSIDPNTQITITPGGTYAIYTALTILLHPGDEVIVFEPAYDSYIPGITVNGAIPVRISLRYPDYSIDWNEVAARITPKTKLIILNNPHNPTGSILTEADILQLRELVNRHSLYILSDEVYEHLVYDKQPHLSILRYPDLLQRSFVCFSFGKVYHCTGWKLGYAISSPQLMAEFRKLHQFNCFSCHTPSQVALADFLQQKDTYLGLAGFLQQKRDYFISLLKDSPFELLPSRGSYFICATYGHFSQEPDLEFAQRLTRDTGVASIPLSAFYQEATDHKVIRFCFAKKEETLKLAAQRLSSIV
ncbi:MAG: methionine aminotransferase [Chitinophagaceae bacterium]